MRSLFAFLLTKLPRDRNGRQPHHRGRRPGASQARPRAARPAGRDAALRRARRSRPAAGGLRAIERRIARPQARRAPSPARRPLSSLRADAVKAHLAKYGPRGPERGRGPPGQDQRGCGQAESPARAALAHPDAPATSAAASSSSTAKKPPATPATPSATAAATSAPT